MFQALDAGCPFPTELHPLTAQIAARTEAWCLSTGLLKTPNEQLKKAKFTWLVCSMFPEGDPAAIQLISDWTTWLFLNDDVCDEQDIGQRASGLRNYGDRILEALHNGQLTKTSTDLETAVSNLRDRFLAIGSAKWFYRRFLPEVERYFEGCYWEAANREIGQTPILSDYVLMRRFTGAVYVYVEFFDLVAQREIPLVVRGNETIQGLVRIANDVACWTNDVFSFEKESATGEIHNIVALYAAEQKSTPLEAALQSIAACNARVSEFTSMSALLGNYSAFGANADAARIYVRMLERLMRGNLDWSLSTGRYVSPPSSKTFAA